MPAANRSRNPPRCPHSSKNVGTSHTNLNLIHRVAFTIIRTIPPFVVLNYSSLGCTIIVLIGLVAAGGFAGRHLLEQYRDGIYAAEDVKQSDSPDESAEACEKPDQKTKDEEESQEEAESGTETEAELKEEETKEQEKTATDKVKNKAVAPISYFRSIMTI